MTDTTLYNLDPLSTVALTDIFYVVRGILPYYATGTSIKAAMQLGGTVTASAPVWAPSQTWNNAAVPFVGVSNDITDTASAAGSLIERWRVNATTLTAIGKDGAMILPKTSGVGIKVDPNAPTYGWRDIIGNVSPKAAGAGSPTRAAYAGANINQWHFAANDLCEFEFHIPHDYVPGTDLYFHVHWSHNDAVSVTGNAVFTGYFSYAKGHNQANFPAEKTIAITYATVNLTTTPQYRHRVDEVIITGATDTATTFARATIEPDGLVILTLKLSSAPTFGGVGKLFVHTCDLHYQSHNMATKQKAPNFYV